MDFVIEIEVEEVFVVAGVEFNFGMIFGNRKGFDGGVNMGIGFSVELLLGGGVEVVVEVEVEVVVEVVVEVEVVMEVGINVVFFIICVVFRIFSTACVICFIFKLLLILLSIIASSSGVVNRIDSVD